jgi:hypothetical protein
MPHTRVFTLEPGQVTSGGGTASVTESDNESWTIDKIQVVEEGGDTVAGVTATIQIAGDSFTDQEVDLGSLQGDYENLPPMDVEWPSNRQFQADLTNNAGSDVTPRILLWVSPMQG